MANEKKSPYACHIFVCTNDRHGKRKSCAGGDSPAVWASLKQEIHDRGWKGHVRVSKCGCMGLCENGPNVILHPQKIWLSKVVPDDIPQIISLV
jgi:NADH:ubiquinone oxidoreductase subunit E